MAEGIELARMNPRSAPVHVIVTDASTWYFFGLQAVRKDSAADPQAGDAGGSAGGAGVQQGASTAGGLEFSFTKSKETFRLFDCALVHADVLGRNAVGSVDLAYAFPAVEASVAKGSGVSGGCVFWGTHGVADMTPAAYCALPRLRVRHWGQPCGVKGFMRPETTWVP